MTEVEAPNDRDRLIASHQSASGEFDRALLSLSGGSLALSIAFVKDLAKKPTNVGLLETSWILMGAALLLTIVSFGLSIFVHQKLINALDDDRPVGSLPGWMSWIVYAFTAAAGLVFLVGAAFLIAFAMCNV